MTFRYAALDVDAYLARIGYDRELRPDLETLRGLHRAHVLAIPFENLDILRGRPIRLDLESLQTKLVAERRGGYCYEQNGLFAVVLEATGFSVTRLAARVLMGDRTAQRPRSHMLLLVDLDGRRWLADVGFGADSPVEPLALDEPGERYRIVPEGDGNLLLERRSDDGGWTVLYRFDLVPQLGADYEVSNHFTATSPHSPFTQRPIVYRRREDGSVLALVGDHLVDGADDRVVAEDEVLDVLRDEFDLAFPAGTTFRPLHEQ